MTYIGKEIVLTGTVHAEEAVSIAGSLKGDILADHQDVVLDEGGRIDGNITATSVTIGGTVVGKIIALKVVRLKRTAWVKSEIAAPRLVMEDGAIFNGSVEPARIEAALRVAAYRRKAEPSPVA